MEHESSESQNEHISSSNRRYSLASQLRFEAIRDTFEHTINENVTLTETCRCILNKPKGERLPEEIHQVLVLSFNCLH